MRYYSIVINNAETPDANPPYRKYSSLNDQGVLLRDALQVELDIPVVPFAIPAGAAIARVWGISLQEIAQASDLNGKSVKIFGGMSKGLPLANPAQSGLLVQGIITQAFGNWRDVNQTLDLIVQADGGQINAPKNIVLPWRAGDRMADAIITTLNVAFPGYTVKVNISDRLVLPHDEPGYYQTLTQFAQYVKQVSQNIIGGTYQGVQIRLRENAFEVYDGTQQDTPKDILFIDLIGQPTWINPGQIQVATVMRADLEVGGYVKLPKGQVTASQASQSQFRQGSVFQGIYQIDNVRHLGNFRQPTGDAWISVFNLHLAEPIT